MAKLCDSKFTMGELRIMAIIATNPALAAALARGDFELSKKLFKVEDGEVVNFTDEEIKRLRWPNAQYEPVNGNHRRIRRRCRE